MMIATDAILEFPVAMPVGSVVYEMDHFKEWESLSISILCLKSNQHYIWDLCLYCIMAKEFVAHIQRTYQEFQEYSIAEISSSDAGTKGEN